MPRQAPRSQLPLPPLWRRRGAPVRRTFAPAHPPAIFLPHEVARDDPRRAPAQSQGDRSRAPPPRDHGHHRSLRLRQELPRLRHHLRGRAAPLRRIALRVRAPVPRADGEARRRFHRRPLPRRRDRAAESDPHLALHRRHRHRDLRFPATALGAHRPHPLRRLRPGTEAGQRRDRHRSPVVARTPEPSSPSPSPCPCAPPSRTRSSIEALRAQGFIRVVADGTTKHLDELSRGR